MTGLSLSMDADTMLQGLSEGLEHPSLHRRLGVLSDLGAWLCATEHVREAASKPQARVLVRLLLTTLCNPQYLERVWIVGLNKAIAAATRSERCPMFTPICVVNLAGEQYHVHTKETCQPHVHTNTTETIDSRISRTLVPHGVLCSTAVPDAARVW